MNVSYRLYHLSLLWEFLLIVNDSFKRQSIETLPIVRTFEISLLCIDVGTSFNQWVILVELLEAIDSDQF